jgi:hypothetical protein
MQDPNQEQPKPRNAAGYRPLVPVELSTDVGNSAIAYVATAAGIGLLVGVGIAFTAHHSKPAAPPRVSAALTTHTSAAGTVPPVYAATASSHLREVENQKKAAAAAPRSSPVSKQSTSNATPVHKKNRIHKLWKWAKGSGNRKAPRRKPYVSPNPPAPADAPTALELATAAAAQGPFFVAIEGDVTVASYDVAMGTIGTREGSTFVLDKTGSENGAIPWDDYPFNVHYRCDGDGNCTLVHHGAAASAKMTH